MRLIQAKVSDELFKVFSHYLVDRDLTVGKCVEEWIGQHCGLGVGSTDGDAQRVVKAQTKNVKESTPASESKSPTPSPQESKPFVPPFGSFQCIRCKQWVKAFNRVKGGVVCLDYPNCVESNMVLEPKSALGKPKSTNLSTEPVMLTPKLDPEPVVDPVFLKCSNCGDMFKKEELTKAKNGKLFCPGCMENQKYGQG